jgi:hypothetical protein
VEGGLVAAGAAALEGPDGEAAAPATEPRSDIAAPPSWATDEPEHERRRPPHRPPRRPTRPSRHEEEAEPGPIAAYAPMVEEPERRRPYRPPRSRREFEERQRAEEEARRAAEAPSWTARARRRDAERSADENEHLSLAAREQQHRMEREAEHRRQMRSRQASRRQLDGAYDVASGAFGEGSALEVEDIAEGGSDTGQQVWAGQGEDDRADD